MQICAKIGGEPWAVDRMPFTNAPTMVVGIDVHSKGKNSFLGCVGTFNNTFTKYHSVCKTDTKGADFSSKVGQSINELQTSV
jgi:aubergine-like protein